MIELGASDAQQLRNVLEQIEHKVIAPGTFQQLYLFAFKFCLTVRACQPCSSVFIVPADMLHAHMSQGCHACEQEPAQKIIDVETAAQMLSIVFSHNPHVPPFTEFLAQQKDYKTVNMDQWNGFLRFTREVHALSATFYLHQLLALPSRQSVHSSICAQYCVQHCDGSAAACWSLNRAAADARGSR